MIFGYVRHEITLCDLEESASHPSPPPRRGSPSITEAGKIAGPDPRKLCVGFGRFFNDISGLMCSFGLAAFVVREYVVVLQWVAAEPPGKSM